MANSAQHLVSLTPKIIQQTVKNELFAKSLERALSTAHSQAFAAGHPSYFEGFIPQVMYFCSVDNADHELRQTGFKVERRLNQLRLLSDNGYDFPVRLRFSYGTMIGDTIVFPQAKGVATKLGVLQNTQHFRCLQPSLFENFKTPNTLARELNLWIIYTATAKSLDAWLGMGTEWLSARKCRCQEWSIVCRKDFSVDMPADIGAHNNDSDYIIDFGEKLTGT